MPKPKAKQGPGDPIGTVYVVYTNGPQPEGDKEVFRTEDFDKACEFMKLTPEDGRWAWENEGQLDTDEHYLAIDGETND